MQRSAADTTMMDGDETLEPRINGVDAAALRAAVDDVRARPARGRYRFRAVNRWLDGAHTRTTVNGFIAADAEQRKRTRPFVLESDLPAVSAEGDRGLDPLEYLLVALGACLTRTLVWHASIVGVHLDAVEVRVEGDIDLAGCLGDQDRAGTGYRQIRATVLVDADAPDAALDDLLATATRLSPVLNTVRAGTCIEVRRVPAKSPARSP